MVASPQRIVLGGGVLQRRTLITKVRAHMKKQLGGYVQHDFILTKRGLVQFIVTSRHGNDAGIVGALTLAKAAAASGDTLDFPSYTLNPVPKS
jgi:fructokinase